MSSLDTIGTKSILDADDAMWLDRLVEILRDHGEHCNAIYLERMLQNNATKASISDSDRTLLNMSEMQGLIKSGKDADEPAWEMYAHDSFGHMMHWINSTIINQLTFNNNDCEHKFNIDYEVLYNISNHTPPSFKPAAMRIFAEKLLRTSSKSKDWEVKITACDQRGFSFIIKPR